jgi:hypothetical protein
MNPDDHHLIFFLPFLRLSQGYRMAGVEFVPLRHAKDEVPAALKSAAAPMEKILSGYVDRHGKQFSNCVVATIDGRWDLRREEFPIVKWAASLLFLASWASNDYFRKHGDADVNSTAWRIVGQSYSGAVPHYISIVSRRRNGRTMDGGYRHGEFKFNLPIHCSIRVPAGVDEGFATALDAADRVDSTVIQRLRRAIPFVELANTDDELMTEDAEAILMGSAFEQLLDVDGRAYELGKAFGAVFRTFGSATVGEVQQVRPGIEIDTSTPERAAAQPKWFVHQKWMEELYDVRSKVVHRGTRTVREWGWSAFEHLLMAAQVFPLTVKLLMEREGNYTLSEEDRLRCLVVDRILASPEWFGDQDADTEPDSVAWKIVSKVREAQWTETFAAAIRSQFADSGEADKTDTPRE